MQLVTSPRKWPLHHVIWWFPAVFLIHDTEELLLIEGWLDSHWKTLAGRLPDWAAAWTDTPPWTTARFGAFMLVLLLLIGWGCFRASRAATQNTDSLRTKGIGVYLTMLCILYLNVFSHTLEAVGVRGYVPGLVTVWLVGFPYAVYALTRLREEGWIRSGFYRRMLFLPPLLSVPAAMLLILFV